MTKYIIQTHLMFFILIFSSIFTSISCEESWINEYDLKNYIRDQHPYSEIIEIKLIDRGWSFQVNDTLKGEIWIYSTKKSDSKSEIKKHCINCNK